MKIYPVGTLFQEVYSPYTTYCIGDYCSDEYGTYYEVITLEGFFNSMLPDQLDMMIAEGVIEQIPCKVDRTPCTMWKLYDCTTNRYRKPRLVVEKNVVYTVNNFLEQMTEETK